MDISIVIPLYRGSRYVQRLLDMISEAYQYATSKLLCSVEVIFVNDYPDEKVLVSEKYTQFSVVVIDHEKNIGIQASRIDGLEHSSGKYILILDQDDYIDKAWIFEMYSSIMEQDGDACVCLGMQDRFTPMYYDEYFEHINDLDYYLGVGNVIFSPGQVLLKKQAIPVSWYKYVLNCNGADDYFLWILMLIDGKKFGTVKKYLFMHSPERTPDSIDEERMVQSLYEVYDYLQSEFLNEEQKSSMIERLHRIEQELDDKKKNREYNVLNLMILWKKTELMVMPIGAYLKQKGISTVGVYGLGEVGKCLVEELSKDNISVVFAADKKKLYDFFGAIPVLSWDDTFCAADIVISTPVGMGKKDLALLSEKCKAPVVDIRDLLLDMNRNCDDVIAKSE